MKILAIETSCDETAIALLEIDRKKNVDHFKILSNQISSQTIHSQYGGVFPMMAKREHSKNILDIFKKTLEEAGLLKEKEVKKPLSKKTEIKIKEILNREDDLAKNFIDFFEKTEKVKIDAIAVTEGPGLEPALWVGINFAKALSLYLDAPLIPVNHMEGHIFSTYITGDESFKIEKGKEKFPIISLLVSGGHTELILIEKWGKYKKIGKTRDDASGEAFDKVARMLGLPYPGGPHISKLAEKERESSSKKNEPLVDVYFPRPMINSKDYDFSFSGLKTSVLYLIRDLEKKDEKILEKRRVKEVIAKEFEDSVVEVLVSKTSKAIKEFGAKKLIVGGGVSANKYLRLKLLEKINTLNNKGEKEEITLHFPSLKHCGDNALMIAIAGFYQSKKTRKSKKIEADGTKAMPC